MSQVLPHTSVASRQAAFDVPPESLGPAIAGARALGVRQLAVSIPHKVAVMEHVDEVEPNARRIGAVNTVTREGDRLVGSNSDWIGAMRALETQSGAKLSGAHAVVLGAGGTARAVVFGLLERGARVTVLNRTEERAHALARSLGATDAGPLDALADTPHEILVNTTSVGLGDPGVSPVPSSALRPGSVVMDAVYDPRETRLLGDARAAGAETVPGKWMLVYQAAVQVSLWTGREAPIEVMAAAFDRETVR